MLEDKSNANHPNPGPAQLQREADREARDAEQAQFAADLIPLRDEWAALKNKLAARIAQAHPSGWNNEFLLAHIEDADNHVLSILEDV